MDNKYFKLPINFLQLTKGKSAPICSFEESIAQFLMMIITSKYGEAVGRSDFGSAIWDLEFNQLIKLNEWEKQVRESLEKSIAIYEKRLTDVVVKVVLTEVKDRYSEYEAANQIRRKADVYVNGIMIHNSEPFYFNTTIFISPLSQ